MTRSQGVARRVLEAAYYFSALHMPLWWGWQWTYVTEARFYSEYCSADDFVGWPWGWRLMRFDADRPKLSVVP